MPSTNRLLYVLLAGSILLNAFLLGIWVARPQHAKGPMVPPPPAHIVERVTEGMSAADAAIFRKAFARHLPQLEADYVVLTAVPARIRAALAGPEFDPVAMQAALADLRRVRDGFDNAMSQASLESAPLMSPEGRMQLWRPPGPPP